MNKLVTLAIGTILSAIAAQARATPVTWTFYETGCTTIGAGAPCPIKPVTLPFVLATLSLPGPTSSGSAFWQGAPGPAPVYTGDNFIFRIATGETVSPAFTGTPSCQFGGGPGSLCLFDISWQETAGQLNAVSIELNTFDNTIGGQLPFGLTGGEIASDADGALGGCALTQCIVAGFWQSDLPEPMSASLLVSGLLALGLARLRFRRG